MFENPMIWAVAGVILGSSVVLSQKVIAKDNGMVSKVIAEGNVRAIRYFSAQKPAGTQR